VPEATISRRKAMMAFVAPDIHPDWYDREKGKDMSSDASGGSELREVRGTFADSHKMQEAVGKLSVSGFDRADLSLPSGDHSLDEVTPETAAKPAATPSDAQQVRTLGSSTAATVVGLAAAGITIATGGAAAPAVAAAVLAGGAAGGATFAATGAATTGEQQQRKGQAASGDLVLSIRAPTAEKVTQATTILREAGATNVETIG